MKMIKQLLTSAIFSALTISASISLAHAERISISSWGSPKHYQVSQFVPQFEKMLKEKSGGEIRTRSFSGGEMVKQQFVASAIPLGTIDISLTTLDNWSGHVPEISILTTPLWNKSMAWTRDNLKQGNAIFDYFDQKLRAEGAIILAMFDIGSPVLSTSFPLRGPKSFEGKAIRVFSKGSGKVMQAIGASPTIMGVGDVYSALQRGSVDGAMGGLGGAVGLKHFEVASNMLIPNGVLGTMLHAYVINKKKFESLSPKHQKNIMASAQQARDDMQQYAIDKLDSLIDVVRNNGNTVKILKPETDEWAVWQKSLDAMVKESRDIYPANVVKMIEN
jgi:TRAP-type C4-dicarboxylate transport system substrate-binding protein